MNNVQWMSGGGARRGSGDRARGDSAGRTFRTWQAILMFLLAAGALTSCEDLLTDLGSGDPRDKLVDTWKVEETAGGRKKSAEETYWVEISKHPYDSTRVVIYNFYNVQDDAQAVLSGSTLTLPIQILQGGYTVRGSGQIQGVKANEIIWTYWVDDGNGVEERFTAVYSRLTL
jgi:hypothetical protein